MKLLRCGKTGSEKPAALDKNGKIRDLSSCVTDFDSEHLNFETLAKLQKIDLETLPEISNSTRIGPCISKPGKFIGIGLNFSDGLNIKPYAENSIFTASLDAKRCFSQQKSNKNYVFDKNGL